MSPSFSLLTSHALIDTTTGYAQAAVSKPAAFVHVDGVDTSASISSQADDIDAVDECWRHHFICPSQVRCFGDQGSFVGFFDPLDGDETRCASSNVAPFGPMIVWRVMSSYVCAEGCGVYDTVLEEGVTSVQVLFIKDPYVRLRIVGSDHDMGGVPVIEVAASKRRRRRSM